MGSLEIKLTNIKTIKNHTGRALRLKIANNTLTIDNPTGKEKTANLFVLEPNIPVDISEF